MDSTSSALSTEHRIFHVVELLEAILHELPIKDLLLDMRVCKTWKLAIENSIELQKDLFFLADGDAVPVVQSGYGPIEDTRSLLTSSYSRRNIHQVQSKSTS